MGYYIWSCAVIFAAFYIFSYTNRKHRLRASVSAQKASPLFTVINGITRFIGNFRYVVFPLKTAELVADAKDFAANCDENIFGSQKDYVEGIEKFCKGIDGLQCSATGRISLNLFIRNIIKARRNVTRYIQNNNTEKILQARLQKPIVITGLGRTGSTFLYNLISCDPNTRAPHFFEISWMTDPTPPVASRDELLNDPRIKMCADNFAKIEQSYPNFFAELGKSHSSKPDGIEEELLILMQCCLLQTIVIISDKEYQKWYEKDDNKEFAYRYMRLFLQMMNEKWQPKSHWVLKAPIHSTFMNALHKEFPDARHVFTHRHPNLTVPSWARLIESYIGCYVDSGNITFSSLGKFILDSLRLQVIRMNNFKNTLDKKDYVDIEYDNLVADPIGAVKSIYDHFGLEFTDEFVRRMESWMEDNKQGKHGRAGYSLERYILAEEDVTRSFRDIYPMYYKS